MSDLDRRAREAAVDLLSGMCAGSVNVAVGLPMDTVKVKMQTFPKEHPKVARYRKYGMAQLLQLRTELEFIVIFSRYSTFRKEIFFLDFFLGCAGDVPKRVSFP